MALISCPECGKEVSDRAVNCPNCAFPLADTLDNTVKIKIQIMNIAKVRIFDMDSGNLLWEGKDNTVARFNLTKPTTIGFSWGVGGDKPPRKSVAKDHVFLVDPSSSKKYLYKTVQGMWGGAKLAFSEVDVIDTD